MNLSKKNNYIANIKFRELLLPTLLMATANNITVFVDSVVTSRLCGASSLAAIQIAAPLESFISFLIWTLGIGGSLTCFEFKANNKSNEGDKVFSVSFSFLLIIATLVCILVKLFKNHFISFFCHDLQIALLTSKYLDIQAFTYIPVAYVMGMAYFMRSDNCAKLPFIAILVSNIVNLCMDFVYIKGFGLGIRGASLATLTGLIFASIITTLYFFNSKRTVKICIREALSFKYLYDIIKRGFPSSAIQLYSLGRNIVLNRVISSISSGALVVFSIFNSSMFIPSIMYVGIAQTMSPIVSFFYQDKDYTSARHIAKKSFMLVTMITTFMTMLVVLFPNILTTLFKTNVSVDREMIFTSLRILSISYIWLGIVFVLVFYLQAIKEIKLANVISFLDGFLITAILTILLSTFFGILGCWISIAISSLFSVLIYIIYTFIKKKGFLLIPKVDKRVVLQQSLNGNILEGIKEFSNNVRNKLLVSEFAEYVHNWLIIIEKVIRNIVYYDNEVNNIDIIIYDVGDSINIYMHYIGKEYKFLKDCDDISVNKEIQDVDNSYIVDYYRIIGINCIVIKETLIKSFP